MSTKSDFTAEEWTQVLKTPVVAGTYVIGADLGVTSVSKELRAMMEGIQRNPAPAAAKELVAHYRVEMKELAARKEQLPGPDVPPDMAPEDADALIVRELREAARMLDDTTEPEEAEAFKEWVVSVAQTVAEAGKEGGVLGIGAVQVSDKEKAALANIRKALGLD